MASSVASPGPARATAKSRTERTKAVSAKRDTLIDKLTEADAKYMLKVAVSAMNGQKWEAIDK